MKELEFQLYEDGAGFPSALVRVAPNMREEGLREILHYAMIYGQDGPVFCFEIVDDKRIPIEVPND